MKKTKKFLSLLLVLMMAVSMLPMSVLADVQDDSITNDSSTLQNSDTDSTEPPANSEVGLEPDEVKKVSVYLTSQAEGKFLHAPQNVEVSSNLAENYGYTDKVTSGVSALDVLVEAHVLKFGKNFTEKNAQNYLAVSETGYISKLFEVETSNNGFMLNGAYPNDGTESAWGGYNGTTVTTQAVTNGDSVSFFIYQDQLGWSDKDAWFEKDNAQVDEITAYKDRSFELKLKGISYMMSGYLYADKAATVAAGSAIESAQLALVNPETGALTDITGKTTDENGAVSLTFDSAGTYYLTAYMSESNIEAAKSPVILNVLEVNVTEPDAKITVPSDAKLTLARKGNDQYKYDNYYAYVPIEPVFTTDNENQTKTYYFDNLTSGKNHYYRVSGDEYVTYAGYFTYGTGTTSEVEVTADRLQPEGKTKKTIDHDTSSNGGQNVADIYLNINAKGYLTLAQNATYQIIPERNWQIIENIQNNYVEPDYNYTILNLDGSVDSSADVLSIDENGLISAEGKGTRIVLVTYDAITVPFAGNGPFFGAIWPENTGVFVVSVGEEESGIDANMTINEGKNQTTSKLSGDSLDSEMDVIYFFGSKGEYTFTPNTENCTVSVANPTVTDELTFSGFTKVKKNKDGSFTVPLTNGRNIVRLEKDGKATYQVITAKKLTYTINNGEAVKPGDTVSITFDTVYNPGNKLAKIYNGSSGIVYTTPDNKLVGNVPGATIGIYTVASEYQTVDKYIEGTTDDYKNWKEIYMNRYVTFGDSITIPKDYAYDTYTLTGGKVRAMQNGFSLEFGKHREVSRTKGAPDPNVVSIRDAVFGSLPDIEIPIVKTAASLNSITLATDDVKTTYYEDEAFDTENLVVTANYSDGTTQIATNYTVTPSTLTKDTTKVVVAYNGKTATIPVTVNELKVTELTVDTQPTKTNYTEGDVFNPTGIKITATYEGGNTEDVTSKVTYSGTVLNTIGDAVAVTASYTKNGITKTAAINVKVAPAQSSETKTDTIKVYFTLLGDDEHGTPTAATGTHTLKSNNLKTWISRTSVTLPKNAKVIDLVEKALGTAGIPFTNPSGNYIDSIKGLAEFSNGQNSGWMYTLNGVHSDFGVSEQTLTNGDKIVFHYTDDYTVEQGSDKWKDDNKSSGGNGGSTTTTVVTTDTVEDTTVEGLPYKDVKGHWALDSIKYAYDNGFMNGTGDTKFSPNATLNRAMLATIIYRLAGSPAVSASGNGAAYTDVTASTWYSDAIAWASANGIVTGYTDGTFKPDTNITREELATMLYRYAKLTGCDVTGLADLAEFTDKADIDSWALTALEWANAEKLVNGRTSTTIVPSATATRAEAATILMRFAENVAK